MTLVRTIKALLSGAIALAGVVGVVAPSQAAVYRATWDPAYGRPFPDLGWRGEVEFTTPNCAVDFPPWVSNATDLPEDCVGPVQVNRATVYFYDIDNEGNEGNEGNTASLDFGSAPIEVSFEEDGRTPDGLRSTMFRPLQVTTTGFDLTEIDGGQAWFSLIFLENSAQLFWFTPSVGKLVPFLYDVFPPPFREHVALGLCGYPNQMEGCGWATPDGQQSSRGSLLTFDPDPITAVPEPATLALVPIALAAMGLAGLSARRRRAQVKP